MVRELFLHWSRERQIQPTSKDDKVRLVQRQSNSSSLDTQDRNPCSRIVLELVAQHLPLSLRRRTVDPDIVRVELVARKRCQAVEDFLMMAKDDDLDIVVAVVDFFDVFGDGGKFGASGLSVLWGVGEV